jgi:hypothetical protein
MSSAAARDGPPLALDISGVAHGAGRDVEPTRPERPLRHLPPFGSMSIIAALNRPNAAWNFFFLPFAYAVRSFFASLTMCFTITFFAFGLGVLRFTIDRLLLRNNSATL